MSTRIEAHPYRRCGAPYLVDLSVPVEALATCAAAGDSPETIAWWFHVPVEAVQAAIDYAAEYPELLAEPVAGYKDAVWTPSGYGVVLDADYAGHAVATGVSDEGDVQFTVLRRTRYRVVLMGGVFATYTADQLRRMGRIEGGVWNLIDRVAARCRRMWRRCTCYGKTGCPRNSRECNASESLGWFCDDDDARSGS